jgi:Fe-S-cluster containining protein
MGILVGIDNEGGVKMQFAINWDLPEAEFRRQIETLIRNARKSKIVIPLPCHIGDFGLELMALVLSQVNCDGCDAPCCHSPEYAEFGIPLLGTEYQALVERIGMDEVTKIGIKLVDNTGYIPTPCPFLRKKLCSIYDIRPIACVNYPVDRSAVDSEGSKIVSLDSLCPEARRIAKRIYMTYWTLINKRQEVLSQVSDLKAGARREETLRTMKRMIAQEEKKTPLKR